MIAATEKNSMKPMNRFNSQRLELFGAPHPVQLTVKNLNQFEFIK
jgi:hypothetical protein